MGVARSLSPMRIVFLGTPQFAVPSLEALVNAGHQVIAVYTQPDRPKGRGNLVAESPVKQAAAAHALPVFQPERIRRPEAFAALRDLGAELMVVVGYGQIIPQSIIDLPRYGILNVHGSLLPKYRGAAPIQWSIANGEVQTGVTIMQIDAGLDTGDMLLKGATSIGAFETAPQLGERLALLGASLLLQAIEDLSQGRSQREKQNSSEATYAPILKKEDGLVRWTSPAREIHNRLRGFTPWPGAFSHFRHSSISLVQVVPVDDPSELSRVPPGAILMHKRRLFAGCGNASVLEILELQPAGKKRMSAEAFLNGYKPAEGECFTSPEPGTATQRGLTA